ncbi:unnamed protein product [Moneuplotes crassus]|uniref:Uncharacterized protein n=1 Tax=Euplotes crassus TaxID=5936 RepID=A0AAD1XJW1_EUPCR|nr:unnamed protein product [Moneuplotes crassus]
MGRNCQGCCDKGQIMKKQRDEIEDLDDEIWRNEKCIKKNEKCIKHLRNVIKKLNNGEYQPYYLKNQGDDFDDECEECSDLQEELDQCNNVIKNLKKQLKKSQKDWKKKFDQLERRFQKKAQQCEVGRQDVRVMKEENDVLTMMYISLVEGNSRERCHGGEFKQQSEEDRSWIWNNDEEQKKIQRENESLRKVLGKNRLHISALQKSTLPREPVIAAQVPGLGPPNYQVLFTTLINKLQKSIECPISFTSITSPAVCPSGNTVDEDVFLKLVASNSKDPFKKVGDCKALVVNRYMLQVIAILKEFGCRVE